VLARVLTVLSGRNWRLPTLQEWRLALGEEMPFGKFRPEGEWNTAASSDQDQPSPVGMFPPNKLGFYDLVGNVWEWTVTSTTCPPEEGKYKQRILVGCSCFDWRPSGLCVLGQEVCSPVTGVRFLLDENGAPSDGFPILELWELAS